MNQTDEKLGNVLKNIFHKMRCKENGSGDREQMDNRRAMLGREMLLKIIAQSEKITQKKLAEMISIRPQSLSESLRKLERDGFIVRTKNEKDKREVFVSLTEAGMQRAEEVEQARKEDIANFLSVLSTEEKETLIKLLEKLFAVSEDGD